MRRSGTVTALASCEWLEKEPLKANFGNGSEDAGMKMTLTGEFNRDIFIDD